MVLSNICLVLTTCFLQFFNVAKHVTHMPWIVCVVVIRTYRNWKYIFVGLYVGESAVRYISDLSVCFEYINAAISADIWLKTTDRFNGCLSVDELISGSWTTPSTKPWSNVKFDQIYLIIFSLSHVSSITMNVYTYQDNCASLARTKFRCDRIILRWYF